MSIASRPMTTEELLALPDDGVYREMIRGESRESPRTTRGRPHCNAMTRLAFLLQSWVERQPRPKGLVLTGDARIRLRREPESFVGADLLYLNPEHAARNAPRSRFVDEPPTLVVEILSPNDTIEAVEEKLSEYLDSGVSIVWIVNPYRTIVTVYRPGKAPTLFSVEQELTAEPELPGLRVAVAAIF